MSAAKTWAIRVALVLAGLIVVLACFWAMQALADRSCAKVGAHAKQVDRWYICITPDGRVVEP